MQKHNIYIIIFLAVLVVLSSIVFLTIKNNPTEDIIKNNQQLDSIQDELEVQNTGYQRSYSIDDLLNQTEDLLDYSYYLASEIRTENTTQHLLKIVELRNDIAYLKADYFKEEITDESLIQETEELLIDVNNLINKVKLEWEETPLDKESYKKTK